MRSESSATHPSEAGSSLDLKEAATANTWARGRCLSPNRVLVLLALSIFLAETFVMFFLGDLPPMSLGWEALLDSAILLLILAPVYFFFYRPFWQERQRAEKEIRFLSRQLIRTGEEERKRLARDLHDECGQVLAALQFGLETLKYSIPVKNPEVEDQCEKLSGILAQLGDHLRNITGRLRPAMLDNMGLPESLRWMGQGFSARWDIEVDFRTLGREERLSPDMEIALFRICQEALTNVARHSRAKQVVIQLEYASPTLSLTVSDDGVGFSFPQNTKGEVPQGHSGIGILGMRERVTDLGGSFKIHSARGRGTTIKIELPMRKKDESDPGCHRR